MKMDSESIIQKKNFLTNLAYWLVLLAIVYVVLKYLINIVMPFFLALIFAAVSRPLAKLLSAKMKRVRQKDGTLSAVPRRISLSPKLSAIVSVILLFVLIAGLATLLCIKLVDKGTDWVAQIPEVYNNNVQPALETILSGTEEWIAGVDDSTLDTIETAAANIVGTIGSKVTDLSGKLIVLISSIATSIPTILFNAVICLIATVFIAMDFEDISSFFRLNLSERTLSVAVRFKDSLVEIVWKFIKSYFVIFLITTTEITAGFLIVGQARPLLLGMLIAVFDAFPIVGSGMILLPMSIITLSSGKIMKGIGLLIIYLVVVIVRQIIEPRIVGKRVGLRPIVTLMCMYVGTKLFGGIGLFALPILAAIISNLNDSGTISIYRRLSA